MIIGQYSVREGGVILEKPCKLNVSASDIVCNTRIKSYPDGSSEVLVCDREIFGRAGWEDTQPRKVSSKRKAGEGDTERAMRRARAQVKDLALCTPFKYFVTLTLDGAKVDRYDMAAITRKLNAWLDNQVRRRGLCYVLVPERHKDGAVHFHGFFNGALEAVDSGTVSFGAGKPRKPRSDAQRAQWLQEGGHTVFNLPGWSLGFTTAIELYGEYNRAVGYVCKYIGKDGEKVGGRWYYSGGALGHPEVSYCDGDLRAMEQEPGAYSFAVKAAGLSFVLLQVKGGGEGETTLGTAAVHGVGGAVSGFGILRKNPQDGLCEMPA